SPRCTWLEAFTRADWPWPWSWRSATASRCRSRGRSTASYAEKSPLCRPTEVSFGAHPVPRPREGASAARLQRSRFRIQVSLEWPRASEPRTTVKETGVQRPGCVVSKIVACAQLSALAEVLPLAKGVCDLAVE